MNGVNGRQFIDSNILLYAYDIAEGAKYERARALVDELWRTKTGALSVQVLQEFFVSATSKIAEPLDVDLAAEVVENLGEWFVHIPRVDDVLGAIEVHRSYLISFWDAMIVQSASELGCDTLWTEDLNPGQIYRGVRVENPFAG